MLSAQHCCVQTEQKYYNMMHDDLHSIASRSTIGVNFHDLGVLNADMSSQIYMDTIKGRPPVYHDPYSSLEADDHDFSTGYLQDVLFEFSSKRRRLLLFAEDQSKDDYLENCWTSDIIQNCCENFDTLSQIIKRDGISGMKAPDEEAISEIFDSSSSASHKESTDTQWTPEPDNKGNLFCMDPLFSSEANKKTGTKRVCTKVVYPFTMVKPGGFHGDATLNDINERILMPPTKPVRHPVGDFACRPVVSPDGRGLSGKAVVAFTRVHTQGKGTITIVRTRG